MDSITDQPSCSDLKTTLRAIRSLVKAQLVTFYERQSEPPHRLLCVPSQSSNRSTLMTFCESLMAGEEPALMLESGENFNLVFHDWQDRPEPVKSYLSILLEQSSARLMPASLLCLFYSEPGGFSNLDGETLSNIRQWLIRESEADAPKSKAQPS